MSKNSLVAVVGLLVAVMPFLGFPGTWKSYFFIVAGLFLIFLAFLNHRERKALYRELGKEDHTGQPSYVENGGIRERAS